jgi:hypothetical protein
VDRVDLVDGVDAENRSFRLQLLPADIYSPGERQIGPARRETEDVHYVYSVHYVH